VDQDCNFVGEKMSTAMTPFRWKNCFADVQAGKHDITIRSYLDDVIVPALETLDRRIDELGRSNSPGHEFAQADMEDVLRETKMAFSLSIQSIWERQLRAYLRGCANELRPHAPAVVKVEKADWRDLRKLFHDLRGIAIGLSQVSTRWTYSTILETLAGTATAGLPLNYRSGALICGHRSRPCHRNSDRRHQIRRRRQR
jgi:hypothetical protein